jgi:UDP-N-acetylmuramate dehydrogenase
MLIKEHEPLAPFTTFGIGGPARWFVEANCEDDVVEATAWARERGLALFVLGGGSNLLVSDAGFDGLVLRVGLRGIRIARTGRQGYGPSRILEQHTSGAKAPIDAGDLTPGMNPWPTVRPSFSAAGVAPGNSDEVDVSAYGLVYHVAAGENWDSFVERTVHDNFAGIECLAGIPGTVGGTPVQNVGAYGQEVASVIERVRAFDLTERRFVEFSANECGFAYRRSRFNSTDRGRYIVTRVDYRLTPGGAPTLRYAELERTIHASRPEGGDPSLVEVATAVRQIRRAKGMLLVEGDADCRSAGSFFKNPVATEEQLRRIARASGKEPPRFPAGTADSGRFKVPAAWLIEQSGFAKGYSAGAAGISSRHTLALVNRGGASAAEILAIASQIVNAVEERFEIRLEIEPVLLGF